MTPAQYAEARYRLQMTNDETAKWLGVHRSVAYRYANGSSPIPGPVARALRLACGVRRLETYPVEMPGVVGLEDYVRYADLAPLLAMEGGE